MKYHNKILRGDFFKNMFYYISFTEDDLMHSKVVEFHNMNNVRNIALVVMFSFT